MDEALKQLYYDPATGLGGAKSLYERARQKGLKVSLKEVKEWVAKQEVSQVFKKQKARASYPLTTLAPYSRIQIDLIDVSQLARQNSGVRFLLAVIDTFTRYAWVEPLKSKAEAQVFPAMVRVMDDLMARNEGFPPMVIDSDKESAFIGRKFSEWAASLGITQHLLQNEDYRGTAHVDRFIRTLRELLQRYFTAHNTRRFLDVLPDLVKNYNTRYHRAIKSTPSQPDIAQVQKTQIARRRKADGDRVASHQFQIGDRVRVMLRRQTFQKGTEAGWSASVHKVKEFRNGLWYVEGRMSGYKAQELQPVGVVEHLRSDEVPREAALAAMEEEVEQDVADRRRDRGLRKEGLDAAEAVSQARAPRAQRERRQVDSGFFLH